MDLSTPMRQVDATNEVIGRISEEMNIKRPAAGAGEDTPEGPPTSDLDDILDGDSTATESRSRPEQENIRLSREPAGDEARSERRFTFPPDEESVDYSVSGSASSPICTLKYDGVDRRSQKKRPKGRGLSDVLGHDSKVQVHSPKITASDHRSKFALLDDIPDKDIQDQDVVLKKANYGTPGSDNYRKNMLMAVSSLNGKFGVQIHKFID